MLLSIAVTSKIPYYYMPWSCCSSLLGCQMDNQIPIGLLFGGLEEDEDGARALGIDVRRTKLIAGALSAFVRRLGAFSMPC